MKIDLGSGELSLRENHPVRLSHATGVVVHCLGGRIWITTPGESCDLFLEAGQQYRIVQPGLTLVESIGEGRVRLELPRRGRWHESISRWLNPRRHALGTALCTAWRFSRTDRAASA